MSKHTPGPWAYRDNKIVAVNIKPDWADLDEDYADERISVVNLYGAMGGIDTCADARLIAAAPDLSALLAEAVSRVDDLVDALGKSIIEVEDLAAWSDDARALLARIEGNPQ